MAALKKQANIRNCTNFAHAALSFGADLRLKAKPMKQADVIVCGGGMVGLTLAWRWPRAG